MSKERKKYKQAMANTFCRVPSLTDYLVVTSNSVVSHFSGGSHILSINSSTRVSGGNWGYVVVDVNCDNERGDFQEKSYPRVIDQTGFINAIYDSIDHQGNGS